MHALSLFFALLLFFSNFAINADANKHPKGFSVDLIHRDSPLSPFYNSSMTKSELIRNAALRSMARVNRFHFLLSTDETSELAETDIIPNDANYLMKIFIGTPPVERWAVADTGSDIVWVQCSPCPTPTCYFQDASLFDPTKSSTYMPESCDSKACMLARGYSECGPSNQCMYRAKYGDGSYTEGNLASESINFGTSDGQSVSFGKSVFGCGHNNNGKFNRNAAGLVGLGNGPLSLVSQLGDKIGRKFSYCLPPFHTRSTTKLRFGEEATISGNGVVSTPLITEPAGSPTFYYLNLEGITVGQQKVQTGQSNGNIVIDSGTTLTFLPSNFYYEVEALVKNGIGADEAVVQDPSLNPYKLCYNSNAVSIKNFPNFVVHFTGADLSLNPENFFRQISNNLLCFAIVPKDTDRQPSIYGNVAQFNFDVEYDLDGRKVSFAPVDCTKQ